MARSRSNGYFWWCEKCLPEPSLCDKLLAEGARAREHAEALLESALLKEAPPWWAVEVLSNRPTANRRCKACEMWHREGMAGSGHPKPHCGKYDPFQIPLCKGAECGAQMKLLFVEQKALVIMQRSFTTEKPLWLDAQGAYDAYLYLGKRFEPPGGPGIVVSAVYFSSKYGRKYGTYSPYFPPEHFHTVAHEAIKCLPPKEACVQ